jgi:hypothetical protein
MNISVALHLKSTAPSILLHIWTYFPLTFNYKVREVPEMWTSDLQIKLPTCLP